jgi:hypothetical protein
MNRDVESSEKKRGACGQTGMVSKGQRGTGHCFSFPDKKYERYPKIQGYRGLIFYFLLECFSIFAAFPHETYILSMTLTA